MTFEDRLRNHMHSGEDLFVEGNNSASDITTAGHRRTRRNQIGAGLAAGVIGIGLVLGATSIIGSSEPDNFAAEDLPGANDLTADSMTEESFSSDGLSEEGLPDEAMSDSAMSDSAMSDSAMSDSAMSDSAMSDSAMDTSAFDGQIAAFDVIIAVDDGFAGLRNDGGQILAIESTNGATWSEAPTTGLVNNIDIGTLAHNGGDFAGVFRTFDNNTGSSTNYIGTSTDLSNWILVEVLANSADAFVSGLTISDGQIVSAASVFGVRSEEDDTEIDNAGFIITGPIGGPYDEVRIDAVASGVDRIVATPDGYALSAFGDGTPQVLTSPDGTTWSLAPDADSANQFSTIAELDGALVSIGSTDFGGAGRFQIFQSSDLGGSWSPVAVPADIAAAPWWSFATVSNGDEAAVLLNGESNEEIDGLFISRFALLVSTGTDFTEIDLEPYVSKTASIILVGISSDEVLLQVIDTPENFATDSDAEFVPSVTAYVQIPLN